MNEAKLSVTTQTSMLQANRWTRAKQHIGVGSYNTNKKVPNNLSKRFKIVISNNNMHVKEIPNLKEMWLGIKRVNYEN